MYLGNINNLCYTLYKQRVACVSSSSATLAFHHVTTTMTHIKIAAAFSRTKPSQPASFYPASETHSSRKRTATQASCTGHALTSPRPGTSQLAPQPPLNPPQRSFHGHGYVTGLSDPSHHVQLTLQLPPLPHPLPRQFLAALQVPQAPPLPTDTIAQGTAWRQGQHPACGWPAPAVAAHASDRPALARPVRWALGRTDTDHGGQTAIRLGLVRVCVI